jgi:Concanavalin A-like lectin/glucanases superfamily
VILTRRKAIVSGAAAMAAYSRIGRAQFVTLGGNGQPGGSVLGLPEQWLMHDGSPSTTFADATANNNTLTGTSITWGTGTHNPSPTFNGTTTTAVAAQTAITNFDGTAPFSISLWVNSGFANSQETLVSTLNPASNFQGWELAAGAPGNNVPIFFLVNDFPSNAIEVTSGGVIPLNTTTNVIVTYDGSGHGSGVAMFINGTPVSTVIDTDALSASTAGGLPLHVGTRADGSVPYGGSMSNLQIFSGVITSGQIAAIQTVGP